MEQEVLLTCKSITKDFGATRALDSVDFSVVKGKVCGLVGENGSGKSTLASIIAGIYQPSSGTMAYMGKGWTPKNSLEAQNNGIGIILQEAGTIPLLSVAQNIFIGQEKLFQKNLIINKKAMNKAANDVLQDIGAKNIRAEMMARMLNMQELKVVEIAKAYNCDPRIFIVDETTNVLSHDGREILFRLIHKLAGEGKSVLIISHDIEELIEHCDMITVLKDGKMVTTLEKHDFDAKKIKNLMVGREIKGDYYRSDMDPYSDEVLLEADNITTLGELTNLSMQLHKGEILGIGGLSDCGMHTLGKVLYGEERLAGGKVTLTQKNVTVTKAEAAVKNGMAYISKDRDRESLALDAPIFQNIAISGLDVNQIVNFFVSGKKEKQYVNKQVEGLKMRCRSEYQIVRTLSGGNKQKVAFGKWFAKGSDIFIMDCPTRGIDIGVKQEMYRLIYNMKKEGKSIILISEELPELIGMSDRILIMKNGSISKEFMRSGDLSESEVIEYMI